jgi:small-conductance mechanosensitive channel
MGSNLTFNSAILVTFGLAAVKIIGVFIGAGILVKLGDSIIERVFETSTKVGPHVDKERAKTLSGILKSSLRYTVSILAFLIILELVGIDTKALLGGVAVVGLAVSFGAQNLVRDVITGFFIIYERQYDVGDYIITAGLSGVVEEVGLRTTRLRDWSGDVHIIPNGLVDKTTNRSRAAARALAKVTIPYEVDVKHAIKVIQDAVEGMAEEFPVIVAGPRVLGISDFVDSGTVINIWARTKPLEQWGIERAMRLRVREALKAAGIDIAYPRVVVMNQDDLEVPPMAEREEV